MRYKLHLIVLAIAAFCSLVACKEKKSDVPVIGFVDAFEDETIAQAKAGFLDALQAGGYSEETQTVKILYKNAQGDIPTLTQIVNYFVSEKVDLIASNTTLASITAIQRAKNIPVFMMVSGEPENMQVLDASGNPPANLFGVGEMVDYIDTSLALIPKFVQPKAARIKIGMVYNQSEPQSLDALNRAKATARKIGADIEAMPINNSADAQLVTQSLLSKNIDVFFANPDNVVFAAFETILKNCQQKNVPVFTSEAGLVKRGAVAAYGADIYQWGHQAGEQAVQFLKTGKADGLKVEMVRKRVKVFNPAAARAFHFTFDDSYQAIE